MNTYKAAAVFALVILASFVMHTKTYALNSADFKPGRIIDDVIFTNDLSMTVPQIQQFLESKVAGGSCDIDGSRLSNIWNYSANRYYTHAEWGALKSNPAPYVCLTNYRENPVTKQTNLGNPNLVIPESQTAAEIIFNAGKQYDINPQVLIVLLQKEQALVTDDWPWLIQYKSATGAYCPDTAPCDATKAGFGTQVREAARLFRYYLNTPFLYFVGNNYVLYNPNTSCGGTTVNIENKATAALYHYTPYQPNASALASLSGSGDSCGAYGNRNFWRYFNEWFGATLTSAYAYTFVNSSYSQVNLEIGSKYASNFITIRNNGSAIWYADGSAPTGQGAVRMSVDGYAGTVYADPADPAWLGTKSQIKMTPAIVEPGQDATFIFSLEGPPPPLQKTQLATFVPVVDGYRFMANLGLQMNISHSAPKYSFVGASGLPSELLSNEQTSAMIQIKNTGSGVWYADGSVPVGKTATRLAMKNYKDTGYADQTDPAWLGTKNQIRMTPTAVAPGEVASFAFNLEGPYEQKTEKLHFVPVLDGKIFLEDIQLFTFMSTPVPKNSYSVVSAVNAPLNMIAGTVAQASLSLKNTGNTVWRSGASKSGAFTTRLVMASPFYRKSAFYNATDPLWINDSQISMTTPVVKPGETGVFNFSWKAPTTPGLYKEGFAPVIDGFVLLPDFGMRFDTTVAP